MFRCGDWGKTSLISEDLAKNSDPNTIHLCRGEGETSAFVLVLQARDFRGGGLRGLNQLGHFQKLVFFREREIQDDQHH